MGLNIKNPEVEADIRKLAEMTGESLTAAIEGAVREKIQRLESPPVADAKLFEEELAFLDRLHQRLNATQIDPNDKRTGRQLLDELYDDNGLPT